MHSCVHDYAMEHRWGTRIAVHIPVRLTATRYSVARIGRLTNLSLSGGFIPGVSLRPHAPIHVTFEYPLALLSSVEKLPALVARVCEEGAGVIWCDFAHPAIIQILRAITASRCEVGDIASESIRSSILTDAFAARAKSN